jgi:hypothetical protein
MINVANHEIWSADYGIKLLMVWPEPAVDDRIGNDFAVFRGPDAP